MHTLINTVKNAILFADKTQDLTRKYGYDGAHYSITNGNFDTIVGTKDGVNYYITIEERKQRGITKTHSHETYKLTKSQAKELVDILSQPIC
jgi:hypothetical protein